MFDIMLSGFKVIATVCLCSALPISMASMERAASPDAEIPFSRLSEAGVGTSGYTYLGIVIAGADRMETPAHCINAGSIRIAA